MIGGMNDRLTFERADSATDDLGNVTDGTWTPFLTRWGSFKPERAAERIEAGRMQSSVVGVVKIRSDSGSRTITEADRVLIDGIVYSIISIENPDRRNRFLKMEVERGVEA